MNSKYKNIDNLISEADQILKDFKDNHPKCLPSENIVLIQNLVGIVRNSKEIILAVASIGNDFGYGEYNINSHHVDAARKLFHYMPKDNE